MGQRQLDCRVCGGAAVRDLASSFAPSIRLPSIFLRSSFHGNAYIRGSAAPLRDPSVANEPASDPDPPLGVASFGSLICGSRFFQGGLTRKDIDSESHDSNPGGFPS